MVCWGQVYRSGELATLTESDVARVAALGIRLVCDLRTTAEAQGEPDQVPPGAQYAFMPIFDERSFGLRALMFRRHRLDRVLLESYTGLMLTTNAAQFGAVLRRLSEAENRPALFHCTAGKDRTGLTAMLLLSALGVPEETIIADYTLSNTDYARLRAKLVPEARRLAVLNLKVDDMYPLLVADKQTITGALAFLRERYGGVVPYLTTAAGLEMATVERLRAELLV
jgi:protein-tyrosine phosphatase